MTTANKETLYGVYGSECLHNDPDEAIEEYLDDCDTSDFAAITLDVWEYKRVKAILDPNEVLEDVLRKLDEDFSMSSLEYFCATPNMKIAAQAFCILILAEYVPCDYRHTGKVDKINALDWVHKNRPDWLKQDVK